MKCSYWGKIVCVFPFWVPIVPIALEKTHVPNIFLNNDKRNKFFLHKNKKHIIFSIFKVAKMSLYVLKRKRKKNQQRGGGAATLPSHSSTPKQINNGRSNPTPYKSILALLTFQCWTNTLDIHHQPFNSTIIRKWVI